MPVQLDLEDYYMWQYEYKVSFKSKVGQVAQLTLEAVDLFGKWGNWFLALDWLKQGGPEQEYILQVEYEQVRHLTHVCVRLASACASVVALTSVRGGGRPTDGDGVRLQQRRVCVSRRRLLEESSQGPLILCPLLTTTYRGYGDNNQTAHATPLPPRREERLPFSRRSACIRYSISYPPGAKITIRSNACGI